MSSEFDAVIDRRNTDSLKWDVADGELPMWVADMDFSTAPAVRKAIAKRAEKGVFGYSVIPERWYEAYTSWWKRRHGLDSERDWFIFCSGVIPAISSAVRKLTTPAENVVVLTPVYNIFFNSVLNNGRVVKECPLRYEDGGYEIDFFDLESALSDPQTTMMILCNPHNPIGKIWSKEELCRIGEMCRKYSVTVISDEIHCDLTDPGKDYTPFASASDTCRSVSITCLAPTKAFNIAGIQTAAVMVPDPVIRHKVWRGLNTDEVAEPNSFAVDAAVAAFFGGAEWLDSLRAYIAENKRTAREFIENNIPSLTLTPSDATYLLWLHYAHADKNASAVAEHIRSETGLFLSSGEQYRGNGADFFRLNIACPRSVLLDGLNRLKRGLESFEKADKA